MADASQHNWSQLSIDGDPQLLVARRKSSGALDASSIDLHEDVFPTLQEICLAALDEIDGRSSRPYAPFGALENDQYYEIEVGDLPRRTPGRRASSTAQQPEEAASALSMIATVHEHPALSLSALREGKHDLYAICYQTSGGVIGFVRKAGPRRGLKAGLKYFQYGDALKRLDDPDLVVDDRIDIVVTSDRLAVLDDRSFQTLFSDVHIAMREVPKHMRAVTKALSSSLPLSASAQDALASTCQRSVRAAKRLHDLVTLRRDVIENVTRTELDEAFDAHDLADLCIKGELVFEEDRVAEFFDCLEGRLFHDDYTGESRRADRFSPRGIESRRGLVTEDTDD